eukprot:jgi/Tetstr1/447265/TSEL_034702.t1
MGRPDPYETLGVHKNSTLDQIRAAYRKLAIKTHPDKTGGDDTQFKKVADAYETLSDPNKRRMHDTGLPGGPNGFESFFGAFNRKYSGSPSPSQIPCDPFQDGYRNPSTPLVKESMGILGGDLVINLDVKWPDILDI